MGSSDLSECGSVVSLVKQFMIYELPLQADICLELFHFRYLESTQVGRHRKHFVPSSSFSRYWFSRTSILNVVQHYT